MMGILGGERIYGRQETKNKGTRKYNRQLQAFNIDRKLDLGE